MKKFTFPLDRVMDWRRTQARVEEAKLERLFGQVRTIEARQQELRGQREASEKDLLSGPAPAASEWIALDNFRRFTVSEHARLERERVDCQRRIAAQFQIVSGKRRDLRLLERLKDRRLAAWKTAYSREADAQADEAYVSRWQRE
jgi:flagellar export protein FliJ